MSLSCFKIVNYGDSYDFNEDKVDNSWRWDWVKKTVDVEWKGVKWMLFIMRKYKKNIQGKQLYQT